MSISKVQQMFEREKQEIESAFSKPQPLKPYHRPAFHALLHERHSRTRAQGERSEVIRLYLPASELLFILKLQNQTERHTGAILRGIPV